MGLGVFVVPGGSAENPEYSFGQIALAEGQPLLIICTTVVIFAVVPGLIHVYFDRTNLPDIGPFIRFEFPSIGHVYDANGQPLIELAREYRQITQYEGVPSIFRDAILATEDRISSHMAEWTTPEFLAYWAKSGLELCWQGLSDWVGKENSPAIFPRADRQSLNSS